jgi:hypothetical protein
VTASRCHSTRCQRRFVHRTPAPTARSSHDRGAVCCRGAARWLALVAQPGGWVARLALLAGGEIDFHDHQPLQRLRMGRRIYLQPTSARSGPGSRAHRPSPVGAARKLRRLGRACPCPRPSHRRRTGAKCVTAGSREPVQLLAQPSRGEVHPLPASVPNPEWSDGGRSRDTHPT